MRLNSYRKSWAVLLAVVMLVSAVLTDGMHGMAAEHISAISGSDIGGFDVSISDVSSSDISGSDVSGADMSASDISSSDISGSDVSGADVSASDINASDVSGSDVTGADLEQNIQTEAFWVTDESGVFFGSYEEWADLVADFKINGSAEKHYLISVAEDAVIGRTMPSKAAKITLTTALEEQEALLFESSTLNMTTPLTIKADSLCVADTGKPINVNTKGKALALHNTTKVGTIKGTSKGSLSVYGNVALAGNLQTFQYVNVNGTFQAAGNVSGVSNLVLAEGTVYLSPGKNFTVTNVDATVGGVLGFWVADTFPKVKIAGQVSGVLDLKLFQASEADSGEITFAAGSKLLTAPKASVEQFRLAGEGQTCYKKSNVIYVAADVLMLYSGEEYLGVYSRWSDVRAHINGLKDKTAEYTVVLMDDYVENGALSMPAKGRYAGLTFESKTGEEIVLKATGTLALTADTVIGPGIRLAVSQVTGTAWSLLLKPDSSVITTGNVSVKNLTLETGAGTQVGGKLTVKNRLEATADNELVLTLKKGAAVKDVSVYDRIQIRMIDKNGIYVTPVQDTTIITTTGTGCVAQFCLLSAEEQELPLYSRGTALKVKGDIQTPIALYRALESETEYLGHYATLADIKTAIDRFKQKEAIYYVELEEELFVKGSLPLPKAGNYGQIVFSGERIRITGNVTLTGNTVIHNKIMKVKNQTADSVLSLSWNLSKYVLQIPADGVQENMGNVTGTANSCLHIGQGAEQVIAGNLKVDNVILEGVLRVDGDITVTDITSMSGNRLDYDLTEKVTVKGMVDGAEPLLLNPMRDGVQSVYTEGMKVLSSAPKLSISNLKMAQETDWVLYKDGSVVRLGKALMTVFENTTDYESVWDVASTGANRFVRINDALDYIKGSQATDFVIRLEENIPSSGAFNALAQGKNIVLCGLEGERKILNITGSMTLDGCNLVVRNIELKNKSTLPGVIMKNQASLWLENTDINTLNATAGTAVTLEGQVRIKGTVSGSVAMTVLEDADVGLGSTVTVNSLELSGVEQGTAKLNLRLGRKMTVKGAVMTPEEGQFIINRVDQNSKLAEIAVGTVMVVASQGDASQFRTENIMPGSFLPWSLIKKGDNIQTSEASQGDGEWSGDYL